MSLNMYLGETGTQKNSMNMLCIEIIQGMEKAKTSINSFRYAILLQGETYSSAKEFMAQTYLPLAQGIIYLCEELIRQNDKYPSDFRSQVANVDVVEQEVLEQIDEINRLKERLMDIGKVLPFIHAMGYIYDNMIEKLRQKLEDLYTYNSTSSSNYDTAMQLADNVAKGLAQVAGGKGFNSNDGIFSTNGINLDWVAKLDDIHYTRKAHDTYGEYLEEYPEDVDKIITIIKYEEANPQYVDQTNEFLDPLEAKDTTEIKFLMYTAEEPYRTLSIKYLDRFEIKSTNQSGVFRPSEDVIEFNVAEDRVNPRGSYNTFFHEVAHAVDHYSGEDNDMDGSFSEFYTSDGRTLSEHMDVDAEAHIREQIGHEFDQSQYDHLSAAEKAEMTENVTENIFNYNQDFTELSSEEQNLQIALEQYYNQALSGADHSIASDVYGGVTNHTIRGSYGHSEFYWINEDGDRIREPNGEGFAEYFGRVMTPDGPNRKDGLGSMEEHLPESREHIEEMLEEMNGE